LGYEIYVAPQFQLKLFEEIEVNGKDLGLKLYGNRALMSLRLEKNWGVWTLDFRPDFTAIESGLDAFINWNKDFIGKEPTLNEKKQGPKKKLVTMTIDTEDIDVTNDEAILKDQKCVGYITSGGYAHHAKKSMALGYVPPELSKHNSTLDVENKNLGYVIIINDISKLNRAQKKAAWGEVAVRMAHEIKNPLTPILLSAQRLRNLFLDKLDSKDSAIINKTTKTIIDQVASMDSMVSAFANYANTPEIKKVSASLNALVNKAASLYDNQTGVRIDLDLSGDLPKLQLDKDSISRALINLIKNCIESKKKKTKLNIVIKSQIVKDEGIVRLTVVDDGDGFPIDIIDQVFEPYVTTKSKGSGLGLAIVQNIVEQHDGQIYASNVEPHGARVTIEFSIIEHQRG